MDLWKKSVHKLRVFGRLSWAERLLMLRAWFLLEVFRIGLLFLGFQRCMQLLARLSPKPADADPLNRIQQQRQRRIVRMVQAATRNCFYPPNCLRSSLVICYLARRAGLPVDIQIGVRFDQAKLDAHAWVESHGVPINDSRENTAQFRPFDDLKTALLALEPRSSQPRKGLTT